MITFLLLVLAPVALSAMIAAGLASVMVVAIAATVIQLWIRRRHV